MQQTFWKTVDKYKSYVLKQFWIGIFYRKIVRKGSYYFPENLNNLFFFFIPIARIQHQMSQKTYQMIQVNNVASTEVYDHGFSPLPMQNPYSKLIFDMKYFIS